MVRQPQRRSAARSTRCPCTSATRRAGAELPRVRGHRPRGARLQEPRQVRRRTTARAGSSRGAALGLRLAGASRSPAPGRLLRGEEQVDHPQRPERAPCWKSSLYRVRRPPASAASTMSSSQKQSRSRSRAIQARSDRRTPARASRAVPAAKGCVTVRFVPRRAPAWPLRPVADASRAPIYSPSATCCFSVVHARRDRRCSCRERRAAISAGACRQVLALPGDRPASVRIRAPRDRPFADSTRANALPCTRAGTRHRVDDVPSSTALSGPLQMSSSIAIVSWPSPAPLAASADAPRTSGTGHG